ncbi:MAG: UDP-N-acetylmuramoyl-L-alanyl-D-glutamate--2,6-diaminopimelate ligase [Verrucomicrobiae bacterium]|nr:UDP-N-acetylmuramoyl-L-alanyl-D-glutamate--2,6-diaminopimelate ligase [Verrucomicrobiae bacterium]
MTLRDLLRVVAPLEASGDPLVEISGIRGDSRRVRQGDIFIAMRGEGADGHEFIADAVAAGAAAVVYEKRGAVPQGVPAVRVADGRRALARLADAFHGNPSSRLTMVGITGTNGKTTTSLLVASILEAADRPTGIIGTLAIRFGGREIPAANTTPPADDLHEALARMEQAGMKAVAMEVSSHALHQGRVEGVAWDAAVFTNFTQDHLDYHRTMDAYFTAKKRLFEKLGAGGKKGLAILNADDPRGEEMRRAVRAGVPALFYGESADAQVRASCVETGLDGSRFTLRAPQGETEIRTRLFGAHNTANCLAAAATGLALGADLPAVARGIAAVTSVPGRLERVGERPAVFVDYAHTEDALRRALATLRPFARGQLLLVFGCGGGRDRAKRRLMGRAAAELADFSFVTSDNPRFEEPAEIADEILQGFGKQEGRREKILDRRAAICAALARAGPEDVVLVAGKGHETYQEARGVRNPFDDRAVVRELIAAAKGGGNGHG